MLHIPDMFSAGGTVKIYTSNFGGDASGGADRVTGSAFGVGLDLAAAAMVTEQLSFAFVVRDVISIINWDSSVKGKYSEGTPTTMILGGAYQDDRIAITFDLQPSLYNDVPARFGVGTELTVFGALKPRIGLTQNLSSADANRWVTIGMGVDLEPKWMGPIKVVRFGYTHMLHEVDFTPRVGLTIGW